MGTIQVVVYGIQGNPLVTSGLIRKVFYFDTAKCIEHYDAGVIEGGPLYSSPIISESEMIRISMSSNN